MFQTKLLSNLISSSDLGKVCRTIMRSFLTPHLMGSFSCYGQCGKRAFKETQTCKVVLSKYIQKLTNILFYRLR